MGTWSWVLILVPLDPFCTYYPAAASGVVIIRQVRCRTGRIMDQLIDTSPRLFQKYNA